MRRWKLGRRFEVLAVSTNRGRVTTSFSPHVAPEILSELDRVLISALRLPAEFTHYLEEFCRAVIMAGR